MARSLSLLVASAAAFPRMAAAAASSAALPRHVASFDFKHPAVATLSTEYPTGSPALTLTTYVGFGTDGVYAMTNLSALFESVEPAIHVVEEETKWPSMATFLPAETFDSPAQPTALGFFLVAGGFFIPGKSDGSVDVFAVLDDTVYGRRVRVSAKKSGWFYHHAEAHDMNGDGRADILAARAYMPTLPGKKKGAELVWFEQPSGGVDPDGAPWAEHMLRSGDDSPEVDFTFDDIDGDGKKEVIATTFFRSGSVLMLSCLEAAWSACGEGDGLTPLAVTAIDASGDGPFFALQRVDLNGDGAQDLLVTNNKADGTGAVFAYEQPANASQPSWPRHTLASGFAPIKPKIPTPGLGSPGKATAVHVDASGTDGEKPVIVLSTDDGGQLVMLAPDSAATEDWGYSQHAIVNGTGTVGSPACGDANGDGKTDIFVPMYHDNRVEVYSF